MANPEFDYGMILDEDSFLSLNSPYFDFGWDGNPSVQDYINRIAPEVADETEFRLGINERQSRYHIDIPLHQNFQALEEFIPSRHTITERMETILRYALPKPSCINEELETDPESNTGNSQVSYESIGYVCFVVSIISIPFI